MQSMRAHSKQSTNRKIWGNVSVTPGKSYDIPPQYIWQRTVWCLHCSMLSLTLKDRYICTKSLLWRQMLRKLSLWNAIDTKYVQNHYFEGKCSENCYFKMHLAPNMYKIITVKANVKKIVTLKCIWHQICTKLLLWRQMLRKSSLLPAFGTKYVQNCFFECKC